MVRKKQISKQKDETGALEMAKGELCQSRHLGSRNTKLLQPGGTSASGGH